MADVGDCRLMVHDPATEQQGLFGVPPLSWWVDCYDGTPHGVEQWHTVDRGKGPPPKKYADLPLRMWNQDVGRWEENDGA